MILYPITIPGGSDTYVQYNNGGIFGGDATFTLNDTTKLVTMYGLLVSTDMTYLAGASSNEILKLGEKTGKQRFLSFQDGTNVQWRVNIQGDDVTRDIPANPSYAMAVDSRLGGSGFSIYRWPPTAGGFGKLFGVNESLVIIQGGPGFQYTGTPEFLVQTNNGIHLDATGGAHFYLDRAVTGQAAFVQNQTAGVTDWYIGTQDSDVGAFTGSEYIIGTSFTVPELYLDTNGLMVLQGTTPYQTILNTTHEDTAGGRKSRINFKGQQSGEEETTLARIEVSHDGAADDEKGKIVISTNDGSDTDTPTDHVKIDAAGITYIGDGGTTNYTKIEADGTIEFNGAATVWNDINIGATTLARPAASQPSEANFLDEAGGDTGITTLGFAIGDKASGSLEIPHSYKSGSNFTAHVHWQGILAPAGGTDNVQWRLTYTLARDGQTLDAVTIVDSSDTAIDVQYEFNKTDITVIDGSTKGNNGGSVLMEDQLLFTLERVAAGADDYAGEALVATIGIHYEQDTVGSRQITTK